MVRYIATFAIFFAVSVAIAEIQAPEEIAVNKYRSAIGAAKSATSPKSIENAFSALASLRDALMHVTKDRNNVLESLSDTEFADLQHALPGVLLRREEVIFVKADVDYFAQLASAKGDPADRAFFRALKVTYPNSTWPIYLLQQTDYSGCTRFGSLSLVETYRMWSEFQKRYPDRYEIPVKMELDAVLNKLLSTCACGDAADIVKELEQFRMEFPGSPMQSRIDVRLKDVQERRPTVRTNCISG